MPQKWVFYIESRSLPKVYDQSFNIKPRQYVARDHIIGFQTVTHGPNQSVSITACGSIYLTTSGSVKSNVT